MVGVVAAEAAVRTGGAALACRVNAPSTKYALVQLESARSVWARMQIAAGRRHVRVAERRLHLG